MHALWLILCMATMLYTLRLSGFLLAGTAVPPAWERTLGFVPVATLTALVVASLAARPDEGALRLMAAVGAACAARYSGRAWVCIVVGIVVYGLLRLCWRHAG